MEPVYMSIPKPCSENWNAMDATEQGAFCQKCTKEVLDCSSLKSTDIKSKLETVKNPCIRISTHQLDELNFLEWYNSLALRKQLKYLFLFAFITVFRIGAAAQDTNTRLIQPQYITIDPADEVTREELLEDQYPPFISYQELEIELKVDFPDIKVECTPTLGMVQIYGDVMYVNPIPLETTNGSLINFPSSRFDVPSTIENSNYLEINDIRLTFFIEGDELVFNSNTRTSQSIKLKIKQKDKSGWLYFNALKLSPNQKEIRYPLDGYDSGIYYIVVEQNGQSKAIQLTYW